MGWRQRQSLTVAAQCGLSVQTTGQAPRKQLSKELNLVERRHVTRHVRDGGGPRLSHHSPPGQAAVTGPRERHHLPQLGGVRHRTGSFKTELTQKW